ncbi:mRNA decay activator protein ZFP36-like [Lampris incognitus]|uniref:mRNA decay activator protein ZFP36-like n=1 Tax=Lampris incognitus TaxID=2546036 RepID=UPI0024B4D07C|nr:mRNA decay activator protein ZFP36-like [Lampris incognitus]
MPSYPLSQVLVAEDTMCRKLLCLDLREQNRPLSSVSMAIRAPGYISQPSNHTLSPLSLSQLPTDSSDAVFLSSSLWGQHSEGSLLSQNPNQTHRGKQGFWTERSLSMVETGSKAAASLGWPETVAKDSQIATSSALLSPSSSLTSTSSVSSSSSRYKTELCRSFAESGVCKYGSKCQFAHGANELRDLNRHPKYKTEPCRTFHTIGFCPYGIRCHFVHNNEEDQRHSFSGSSPSCIPSQPTSNYCRPPLLRQSVSFAGFPSVPQQPRQPALCPYLPPSSSSSCSSVSAPSSADITDFLSHAFLEIDSLFEACPRHQPPLSATPVSSVDLQSQFLPSPDSGCSLTGLSPTASPSLRQSPGAAGGLILPMGTRSLSYTSLSDQDQDGSSGSSASSLSGSESCGGAPEGNGRRLAVFSQLSVPDDTSDTNGFCL